MHVTATYTIAEVHEALATSAGKQATLPDGRTFRRGSQRLKLFSTVGITCTACGLIGSYYSLEAHDASITPHLNLYAISPKGKAILMTKDHIMPRSRGGRDVMSNYTPMCAPCNSKKADKLPEAAPTSAVLLPC